MPRLPIVLGAMAIAAGVRPSAAAPERTGEVRVAPAQRDQRGGLRMEGPARLEIIYGDAADLQRTVDRFFALDERMTAGRRRFTRHVRGALALLAAAPARTCPIERLGPLYAAAATELERFWTDGAELEAGYEAIRALDRAGETAALTPDYRWRINRTRVAYQQLRQDLREMRGTFTAQLGREARARGCRPEALRLTPLEGEPPDVELPVNPPPAPPPTPARPAPAPAPAPPSNATFFVDNRGCTAVLSVYIDGVSVGDVGGKERGAFRALPGRHSMCLIPATSTTTCGDAGTLRNVFISDGWSITMHCMK